MFFLRFLPQLFNFLEPDGVMAIETIIETQIPLELPLHSPQPPSPDSKDKKPKADQPRIKNYHDGDLVPDSYNNGSGFSMYK